MTWAHQIQNLLDTREVEEASFHASAVIKHYEKALSFGRDAMLAVLSAESRVTLAYAALHHYADALANLHGLRVKAGRSHHRNLYQIVTHLGIGGVGQLDVDAAEAARSRTRSAYDIEWNSEEELQQTLDILTRLQPIALREVLERHPEESEAAGLSMP